MNFQNQLSDISEDPIILNYFQNKNLSQFLKTYIQIDYLLQNLQQNQNPLLDKLNDLEKSTENDTIKELLDIIKIQIKSPVIKEQNTFVKELMYSLDNNTKLQSIEQNVYQLQQNFTGSSAKKGQVAENILLNNLTNLFPDSEVIDTSHIPNSGDIQIKKENKPVILLDSKCFKNNVPKIDLDKFYADVKTNNCSGILCNSNAGIANRDHFQIDIQDNNVYVFISNHQYDNTLFKLAVKIIYHIHDIIKDNKNDTIEINRELFQRLKIEYNFFLSTFQQHLSSIKTNIMSLEKLAFVQLDHFFKRTNLTTEIKPFSCQLCGTGFNSDKTLKSHLKSKHEIILSKTRKPKKEKVEEKLEVEPVEENLEKPEIITFD
jgi:hypothetical protein